MYVNEVVRLNGAAEGLVVHPQSARLVLVTKASSTSVTGFVHIRALRLVLATAARTTRIEADPTPAASAWASRRARRLPMAAP